MEQINSSEEPAVNVDSRNIRNLNLGWLATKNRYIVKHLYIHVFAIGWSNGTDKQFRRACCEC